MEDDEAGLDENRSLEPTGSDLSASLSSVEKTKETAWATYASAHLGDLLVRPIFFTASTTETDQSSKYE